MKICKQNRFSRGWLSTNGASIGSCKKLIKVEKDSAARQSHNRDIPVKEAGCIIRKTEAANRKI
jgi:hypothetical protein